MSYQPQDGRVERATSRWAPTPVVAACLRVLALVGFAGAAWLLAGASAAHADTGTAEAARVSRAALPANGSVAPAAGSVTGLLARPTAAPAAEPATSALGSPAAPLVRPLAAVAAPISRTATGAVSPVKGNASGALAPATTPASGASCASGVSACTATPAHGSASQAGPAGVALPLDAVSLGSVPAVQGLLVPVAANAAATTLTEVVRPLTDTIRPLADTLPATGSPRVSGTAVPVLPATTGSTSARTGHLPAPVTAERSTAPDQAATPVAGSHGVARTVGSSTVSPPTPAASILGNTARIPVGARPAAPAQPQPAPGTFPVLPGKGTNSGSAAGSSMFQLDGSTGAVGTGAHTARALATRALPVPADSGVPLVRAEDLSVTPD
jgi:hypothetical protein